MRDARPVRNLRVLVDSDVWARISAEQTGADAALRGLLLDDRVEMSLYSDDGPPADVERLQADGFIQGGVAIGWTVPTPSDDEMVAYSLTTATRTTVTRRALLTDQVLMPGWVLMEENGTADDAAALLIATAHEAEFDLLITERKAVLNTEVEDRGNCRFVSPEVALSLIALYVRAAGEYVLVKSSDFTGLAHRRGFYDRAAARLIPSLDTFVEQGGSDVVAARLLTIRRRARALIEARDRLALCLSEPITEDVADAVEATFTHALVDMVAFHDLLARVVNDMLPSSEQDVFQVKWQQDRWRRESVAEFPGLRAAWGDGGFAMSLNAALRAVRNEIHDVAPVIAPFRTRWGAAEISLAFQERVGDKVLGSLGKLSDDADPGVARTFADGHSIRPLVFIEFVLPWMFGSVEATLAALMPSLTGTAHPAAKGMLDSDAVGEVVDAIVHLRVVPANHILPLP